MHTTRPGRSSCADDVCLLAEPSVACMRVWRLDGALSHRQTQARVHVLGGTVVALHGLMRAICRHTGTVPTAVANRPARAHFLSCRGSVAWSWHQPSPTANSTLSSLFALANYWLTVGSRSTFVATTGPPATYPDVGPVYPVTFNNRIVALPLLAGTAAVGGKGGPCTSLRQPATSYKGERYDLYGARVAVRCTAHWTGMLGALR